MSTFGDFLPFARSEGSDRNGDETRHSKRRGRSTDTPAWSGASRVHVCNSVQRLSREHEDEAAQLQHRASIDNYESLYSRARKLQLSFETSRQHSEKWKPNQDDAGQRRY